MKGLKLIVTVFILVITFTSIQAQENKTLENSVLWKIEHPQLNETSYILGTLHVMCSNDFEIPKKVKETLKQVDALVLEVNLSDPKEMKAIQESMSKAKKISEELSKKQFNELDELVQKVLKTPLINFDAYGLTTLNMMLISKMLPCKQIKSLEAELALLAAKQDTPIFSLEKVAEQLEAVKKAYPTEFNFKQIMQFESYKKDFNNAIKAYKEEDVARTVSLITKDSYMNKNATEVMQVKRNYKWVKKMPEMMKEKSVLFAVGAAHLTDNYGIIHLLREKGYHVTPVFN